MIGQPSRMAFTDNEFFEVANHGLSVDQFFRFGSIPIVQSFDAHMLSNQIFAYIYSFFNGYEPWATFLYSNYSWLLFIIPSFFILKRFIGVTNSFLIVLCFPLITSLISSLYILSGLAAICLIRIISSRKTVDYYYFWAIAFLLVIYRADLGSSALLAGVVAYFIICFTLKEKASPVKYFLPGIVIAGSLICIFLLLCVLKGVNPLHRFVELFNLCMSNQSWVYTTTGNPTMLAYIMGYYIMPLFVIISAVWVIGKYTILSRDKDVSSEDNKLKIINKNAFIMSIFFTAFFIFNAPRGIVRHSFAENTIVFILGTIPLALLSLSVITRNSNNVLKFLLVSLAIIILININIPTYRGLGPSMLSSAITSPSYQEQYTTASSFNGTRIRGPSMPSDAESLKKVLDTVLIPQETYFDFASVDYFYALVRRKNPVYVNQSPLMISNDLTQKYALQQIEEAKPPIVLMPIEGNRWSKIDGITVDYKYYMIAEYIYKNYVPIIRLPMFDIYCLKEKKNIYLDKLVEGGLYNEPLYEGNFDFIGKDRLFYNNCTSRFDRSKNLILTPSGNNPYVVGFLKQLKEQYPELNNVNTINQPSQLKIEYYVKSIGSIQMFYILKDNDDFSRQQSKSFVINSPGRYSAILKLPSIPSEFRIDVDTEEIQLENLTITQGLQIINNQPEIWSRNLGEIPRLWAEKDGTKMFSSVPLLSAPQKGISSFITDTMDIPTNESMYLLIQLESIIDSKATVAFGKDQSKLGEFNFTVLKGNHSYALRLSTDFHWWNTTGKYVSLSTNSPVNINKFCFISAESSNYYNKSPE